jgi:hypothetical protein
LPSFLFTQVIGSGVVTAVKRGVLNLWCDQYYCMKNVHDLMKQCLSVCCFWQKSNALSAVRQKHLILLMVLMELLINQSTQNIMISAKFQV